MICSKCGQELKDGSKFCTKCGESFKETVGLVPSNLALPVISIVLSVIGIIGYWVLNSLIQNLYNTGNWESVRIYYAFENCLVMLIYAGILIAFVSQSKQKSKIGFFAGLIPCAYLIILQVYYIVMNLIRG